MSSRRNGCQTNSQNDKSKPVKRKAEQEGSTSDNQKIAKLSARDARAKARESKRVAPEDVSSQTTDCQSTKTTDNDKGKSDNEFLNSVDQAFGTSVKQAVFESRSNIKKSMRGTECGTNVNHLAVTPRSTMVRTRNQAVIANNTESETTTPATQERSDIRSQNQVARPTDAMSSTPMGKLAKQHETGTSSIQTRSQKTSEMRKMQELKSIDQETPAKVVAATSSQNNQNQPIKMQVPIVNVDAPDTDDVVFVEKPAESEKTEKSGTSCLVIVTTARHLIPLNNVVSRLPETLHEGVPKLSVNFKDLLTLCENQDLNDNVVIFLMHLGLVKLVDEKKSSQIYIFDSLFFEQLIGNKEVWYTRGELDKDQEKQLKSYAKSAMSFLKKVDIFQKKLLLMPVCQGGHWMLLVIVNPSGCIVDDNNMSTSELPCRIFYFDSYFNDDERFCNHFRHVATSLLECTWAYKNPSESSRRFSMDRVLFSTPTNIPKQNNGNDCGVFVSHFSAGVLSKFEDIVSLPVTEPLNWNNVSPDAHAVMRVKPRHDVIRRILKLSALQTRIAIHSQWRNLEFGDYE